MTTESDLPSRLAALAGDLLRSYTVAAPFCAAWPPLTATRPVVPAALPVLRWLPDVATRAAPATDPLVAALVAGAADLAWWQTYTAADFGPAFLDRYGWVELIGTRGPIASDEVSCGVLMLGPHLHYPAHAHEAEELYVPLAGTALWQRGDAAPAAVPPGAPIHHPSWLSHAMRTGAEPLLALYAWRGGELGAKPRIVGRS